jgi:hypothetical protein
MLFFFFFFIHLRISFNFMKGVFVIAGTLIFFGSLDIDTISSLGVTLTIGW